MNEFVKNRECLNNPCISLSYDGVRDSIRFDHEKAIVKITDSIKQNMENTYRHLYDEFQYDIDQILYF
jgi:hypothetical protein